MIAFGQELVSEGILRLPFPKVVMITEVAGGPNRGCFCKLLSQGDKQIAQGSFLMVSDFGEPIYAKRDSSSDQELYYYLAAMNSRSSVREMRALASGARIGGKPNSQTHYYVVELSPSAKEAIGAGTHASPRLHWRRGHIRHLASGKKTWVRASLVGAAEGGVIVHDYRVALAADTRRAETERLGAEA
jgi:hypothetical protein